MYKKILLPVDGREGAWRAIRAANQAVSLCSGEIVLVHVEAPVSQLIHGRARKELTEEQQKDGQSRIQPVREFLESKNIKHRTIVVNGNISDGIIKAAHDEEVDLIVMFTDGVSNLAELVLGSTTERVLRGAGVDLLSVRK